MNSTVKILKISELTRKGLPKAAMVVGRQAADEIKPAPMINAEDFVKDPRKGGGIPRKNHFDGITGPP